MSLADQFRERAIECRKGLDYPPNRDGYTVQEQIAEQSLQIQSVIYEVGAAIAEMLEKAADGSR